MAWRRSSAGGMAAPCRSAAPRQWAAVRRRACRATTATGRARWCCTTAVRRWPPRRTGTARCARRADVRQPPPRPRSPPPRTPAATRAARERPRWGPARPPAWQSARRSARPGRQTGAASPAPWWRAPPAPPRSAGDPSHPPWPAAHCRSRSPGPGGAAAPPPAATHGSPGRRGSGPAAGEHAAGGHHGRSATGRAPNPTGPARHHTPGRPAHPRQAPARPGQGRLLPSAPVRLAPPARPSRTVGADGEGLARSRRARACCPGVAAANSDPRHEPEPQPIPTINAAPSSLQPQRKSRLTPLHGYRIGSLITWPLLVFACQAPLSLPVGAMAGALSVARAERLAAGADWSPYSQRQALLAEVHAVRQVARATRRHHEPTNPTLAPALGIAYPGGDLYPWLRRRGRMTEVVIPEREQRLAMAVLGIPGSGKTYTLLRRVWIAARAGMRVVFVDCKGTDPGLAWQVTCAYRLANPGAIVGFWPTQPLDCWRGDGMAIANRLLAVEDWASEGGGVYYRRMATLALQLACTPPSGPPRNSQDFLRRLDHKKLQQLWRGDPMLRGAFVGDGSGSAAGDARGPSGGMAVGMVAIGSGCGGA